MEQNQASITAHRVAMRRAAHQLFDNPKVLHDPIALKILGEHRASEMQAAAPQFNVDLSRSLRAFLAARSRYAEDELAKAVERGVRQYVILGAGLDTFAYRNPHPAGMLQIFEVDYPATQAWKRDLLAQANIAIPESLTYTPIDFETQTLADQLDHAGFRRGEPTFFSWLGVTMYLTRDTVMATMKFIAAETTRGSEIVFDYAMSPETLSPERKADFQALLTRVAAVGEPWQTFFDPLELSDAMRSIGFAQVEDLDSEAINQRFFKDRGDALKVGGLGHLMKARM